MTKTHTAVKHTSHKCHTQKHTNTTYTPSSRCCQLRREEQAGLGEASGAEQDQYAFPLEVAVLPAGLAAAPGQEAA